ncbi:MAG TPA: HDOD domain-containing protein, partial [Longimicrobiales bacterium]
LELGFELFQGFFYTRPEVMRGRGLSPGLLHTLTLLNLLSDPAVPQGDVADAFKSDADLTLRLIRMANAAAVGAREVGSIGHAISLLGRSPLHRWLALIFAASAGEGRPTRAELLRSTLTRARFCESLAEHTYYRDPGEAFLVGLFSRIEPLLDTPLPEILAHVRLAPSVVEALTTDSGPLAWTLDLAQAHERADWPAALDLLQAHGLTPVQLSEAYLEALSWTRGAVEALA